MSFRASHRHHRSPRLLSPPPPRHRQRLGLPAATREMAALQTATSAAPYELQTDPCAPRASGARRGRYSRTSCRPRSAAGGGRSGPTRPHGGSHHGGCGSRAPRDPRPARRPRLTQSLSLSPRGIFLRLDAWRGPALAPRWRDVLAPLLCWRRRR